MIVASSLFTALMRWLAVAISAFSALTSATSGTSRFCSALTEASLWCASSS
jgi:hypothetical protein